MSKKPEPLRRTAAQKQLEDEATDILMADKQQRQVTDDVITPTIPKPRGPGRKSPAVDLKKVAEVLQDEGLDPTAEIVRILKSGELDGALTARIHLELLQYCQPKLKAVELTGKNGEALTIKHLDGTQAARIAAEVLRATGGDAS